MHGVAITELIEKFQLKNITPDIDAGKIVLTHPEVNRPAPSLPAFLTILTTREYRSSEMWSRRIFLPWPMR